DLARAAGARPGADALHQGPDRRGPAVARQRAPARARAGRAVVGAGAERDEPAALAAPDPPARADRRADDARLLRAPAIAPLPLLPAALERRPGDAPLQQ